MSIDQNNVFSALDPAEETGVFDSDDTVTTAPAKTNKLIYLAAGVVILLLVFFLYAVISKFFFSHKPEQKTVPIVDVVQTQQPVAQLSSIAKEDKIDQVTELRSDLTVSDKNDLVEKEREVKDLSSKVIAIEGVNTEQSQQIAEIVKQLNNIQQSIEKIRMASSEVAKPSRAVKTAKIKKTRHSRVNTVEEINQREDATIKADLANDLKMVSSAKKGNGKIKLKAVVEDRAWIEDARGYTTTVTNGDTVPGMGTVVSLDSDNFMVRFDSGRVIKGE